MLSEHDFLTQEDCSHNRDTIFKLKEHWVNRARNFLPFFSLGAASYLDIASNDSGHYYESVNRYNPLLQSHFNLLYEKLSEKLIEIFKMPVEYEKNLALPGFHIFLANRMFQNPIASKHFDVQFQPFQWDYKNVDFENPISFTCPIALPQSPSGLNYWNITKRDLQGLTESEIEEFQKSKEQLFFPYSVGKLVLHRGLILHQIAPCKDIKPTDERITLQGHGLVCDGTLRLYW